jgi:hypothetical protein
MHLCVLAGPLGSMIASSIGGEGERRTCRLSLKALRDRRRCLIGQGADELLAARRHACSAFASSVRREIR